MCQKTIRRHSKKSKSQRLPNVKVRRVLFHCGRQAPVYKPALSVFLLQRTYTGLENQLTTHSPRGDLPGSPKLPETWAYMAHHNAFHSTRCLILVATNRLITPVIGLMGNELLNGYMVFSLNSRDYSSQTAYC